MRAGCKVRACARVRSQIRANRVRVFALKGACGRAICGAIEDAKENPAGEHGNAERLPGAGPGRGHKAEDKRVDNVNSFMDKPPSKGGNSKSYHLRRLSRDAADPAKSKMYADIMTDLETGVIPSVHQAAIKAGYIREKTRVEQMQSLWKKMTEAEREESGFVKR